MRIIAGKYRGKVLNQFDLITTRPTSDKLRGAVFNILGEKINGSTFLDLFSGTGAVGLEAISRGAKLVFFVDNNEKSIQLIKKNVNFVKEFNYQIKKCEYVDALKDFEKLAVKFDIIFLDPPYKTDFSEVALKLIYKYNLLNTNGLVVWEHDETKLQLIKTKAPMLKIRKYGKKYLTILDYENLTLFLNM